MTCWSIKSEIMERYKSDVTTYIRVDTLHSVQPAFVDVPEGSILRKKSYKSFKDDSKFFVFKNWSIFSLLSQ